MSIDIIFLILAAFAVIKGLSRGFIIAVFSLIGVVVGVAAAMKLSYIVANWLQPSLHTEGIWLPVVSFMIVMFGVILLVRWIANLLQAAIKIAMLGWLNKLGGVVLYLFIFFIVYSILLFYLTQMKIISAETINASKTYNLVEPFGPTAVDMVSYIIPVFKDIFHQLSDFFGSIAAGKA